MVRRVSKRRLHQFSRSNTSERGVPVGRGVFRFGLGDSAGHRFDVLLSVRISLSIDIV